MRLRLVAEPARLELLDADPEVARTLASQSPPVRARRSGGRLVVELFEADRVLALFPEAVIEPTARRAVDNRNRVASSGDVNDEARRRLHLPAHMARSLIDDSLLAARLDDHQARTVAAMTVPGGWGTCIFDEQGTGKTVTVIAAFDVLVERGEAEVLVVVAPKSMIAEWSTEFARFTGGVYSVGVVDGTRSRRAQIVGGGHDVVVLNYESVESLAEPLKLLAKRSNVVLAVDESFLVKNPDATRTRALRSLREWCTRCFVLCGTPAPNSPHDIVAQVGLVDFGATFDGVVLSDDRDAAAIEVTRLLAERSFYVRNLKRDVLPDLPSRDFTEVSVRMAPRQQLAYDVARDSLVDELRSIDDQTFGRNISTYLQRRATLLRICSDPTPIVPGYDEVPAKIEALDDLLASLIEGQGEKVIVWSFYRAALDRISNRYAGYGVARIDGSVGDSETRRDAVQRFQTDDGTRLFVGNPAAAGAGLTLHTARVAVYESLSNQAAHFLQSLDRIHRRGQGREVRYITLLCQDTVEEAEYARLLEKADRQADLLRDGKPDRPTRRVMLDELLNVVRPSATGTA